jgi:hypothetical protein
MSQSARGNVFRMKLSSRTGGTWSFGVVYTFKVIPVGQNPDSSLVIRLVAVTAGRSLGVLDSLVNGATALCSR